MVVSFMLCGVGLGVGVVLGQAVFSAGFIFAVVVATFFWSPQYKLFAGIDGDYYGQKHS